MIQAQINHRKAVLRRWVYSALLTAIIALTGGVLLIPSDAATVSAPEEALLENKPWIGDFDEMTKKRQIRVLVVYSKTFYFLDRGRQRGISHDLLKEFENMTSTI